ncbi:MAG TPA: hypothetical protein PLD20_00730 [Blastocatellia bacterium]|nr:hypothetical protein [Blastocatellia bacterium]HMY72989.1 hypothetical protein [Blastocatellia bacterium]HMZ16459.1 hypothetical protein [Blastocatellia bacterium]HNG29492.1 hypothetical protein [Blastocatellia bacterium]
MTMQEIAAAIPTLSFDERMALLTVLTFSLRDADGQRKYRGVPASELRGVLKTSSPPPTDDEVKDAYEEYLTEKYK